MAYPSDSDFQLYDGSLITQTQFDYNFQRIPVFWSSGNYDINVNSITATTYNGLPTNAFTAVAGESIDAGDIVRFVGAQVYKASNSSSAGITNVIGISSTTTASGQTATIETDYYNSFSSLTAGDTFYVGVDGAKTTTKPTNYPYTLGKAVSATRINLDLSEDSNPTGSIITIPLASAPEGYLLCDGSAVSRTTHARLFGSISTTYGDGDGSTTFNLPDYRGLFLRATDSGTGIDPDASTRTNRGDGTTGDNVGTKQDEMMNKLFLPSQASWSPDSGGYFRTMFLRSYASNPPGLVATNFEIGFPNEPGNEIRPRNVNVNFAIKL